MGLTEPCIVMAVAANMLATAMLVLAAVSRLERLRLRRMLFLARAEIDFVFAEASTAMRRHATGRHRMVKTTWRDW